MKGINIQNLHLNLIIYVLEFEENLSVSAIVSFFEELTFLAYGLFRPCDMGSLYLGRRTLCLFVFRFLAFGPNPIPTSTPTPTPCVMGFLYLGSLTLFMFAFQYQD